MIGPSNKHVVRYPLVQVAEDLDERPCYEGGVGRGEGLIEGDDVVGVRH